MTATPPEWTASDRLPSHLVGELDTLFRSDPYANRLGARIVDWSLGSATVEGAVAEHQVNFLGAGHGGFIFSLADVAMAVASNTTGRVSVAIQVDIAYLRPAAAGDGLLATARVTNLSRRFAHLDLAVTGISPANGRDRTVATATGICYRTDDWHLGPEQWPEEWRATY